MLTDKQLDHFGDVLLWGLATARKTPLRPGDVILLQYDIAAVSLAEILFEKILSLDMHPIQRVGPTVRMEQTFYRMANDRQLTFRAPGEVPLSRKIHGRIYLHAPSSLTHLREADPARIGRYIVSRKPLRKILDRREEKGEYGWTLCTLPTMEMARHAKTSLRAYEAQVVRACFLDEEPPVSAWREIHREIGEIKQWLGALAIRTLRIESRNVDLEILVGEKRRWQGLSGHNIPSFEVFVSPDWRGTRGEFFADLPSFRSGNTVEGIRLTFEKGVVVGARADRGEAFAAKQIAMDAGSRRVGEFSLTDRRFSRIDRFMADTLFDENFGGLHGNCHIAVGASYTDCYDGCPGDLTGKIKKDLGFNDSALHWDLVNTEEKTVTACLMTGERRIIYDGGMFRH